MMRTAAIFPGATMRVTESHNLYPAWEALCFVTALLFTHSALVSWWKSNLEKANLWRVDISVDMDFGIISDKVKMSNRMSTNELWNTDALLSETLCWTNLKCRHICINRVKNLSSRCLLPEVDRNPPSLRCSHHRHCIAGKCNSFWPRDIKKRLVRSNRFLVFSMFSSTQTIIIAPGWEIFSHHQTSVALWKGGAGRCSGPSSSHLHRTKDFLTTFSFRRTTMGRLLRVVLNLQCNNKIFEDYFRTHQRDD